MPRSARQVVLAGESEELHQQFLFDWIRSLESQYPDLKYIYHVPNGGKRSITVARKLKRAGVRPGIFDISCDTARKTWRGFRYELKFGRNKLTDEQRDVWLPYYEAEGYQTGVFYTWVEAALAIIDYFDLPDYLRQGLALVPPSEAA
jgi:hypothetical protein